MATTFLEQTRGEGCWLLHHHSPALERAPLVHGDDGIIIQLFHAHSGLHEDLERLERVIVKDYKQEAKTHKDKLMQNHRVRKRIDEMQEIARKLVS